MIQQELSKIQQADFLRKHHLSSADFKAANLNYEELLNISSDFESKRAAYEEIGNGVVKILFKFDAVHSINYQVKKSEELMQSLLEYQLQNPANPLDLTNYEKLIENLISIRIIPLFKSDWAKIHDGILDQFVVFGKVHAKVRVEDHANAVKEFTDKGFEVIIQPDGYRSVDYVIKTAPSKKEYKVAVQIRSIFEEGWAAIDHRARYQDKMDDLVLNDFSRTLNKLTSGAEEISECIHGLKSYLNEKEILIQDQQALLLAQQSQLTALKAQLAEASLEKKESIASTKQELSSNGSAVLLNENILKDLAETAAANDGGAAVAEHLSLDELLEKLQAESEPILESSTETQISDELQTSNEPKIDTQNDQTKTESAAIEPTAVTVAATAVVEKAAEEKNVDEKPKTVKPPKLAKAKEGKAKLEQHKEEKQKLEMTIPVVKDLFGQTRIPDAAPLKPATTNT